ncbi:MAG: DoxX family membrane protein [Verrucomicrobiota bacterium JB022]|nr:DoxX family membrane protein [Verrucomicrobiota bacterium JB022]
MASLANQDYRLAHSLARWGLGINIALHGYTRLPTLGSFAATMQENFAQTILPGGLVYATSYLIVLGEVLIGTLLVLGLWLRPTLIVGAAHMILLITGACLIQNWSAAGTQMVYLAFYVVLLATARHAGFLIGRRD